MSKNMVNKKATVAGNAPKWTAYGLAWSRVHKALDAGFPLEAIAIEESIFSDRLNSCRAGRGESVRARDDLKYIVGRVKKFDDLTDVSFMKLLERIESWYADRCRFLHGIVRSDRHDFGYCPQGASPVIPAEAFVPLAQKCAERGEKLARQLCNWSKSQVRMHKRVMVKKEEEKMINCRLNRLPFMSMVKNMSQVVCVSCCLAIFAINKAMADVTVANGYTWQHTANMYTDEACILGVEPEPSGAVEVPERLGGCRVTKILGSPYVFSGCKKLESVKLPNSVSSLDGAVFDGCSGLRQVVISLSTQMSSLAFRGCESLQDAQGRVIVNGWLFGYYGTSGNVVVPEGVACIDRDVFKNSTRLATISLPNGLRSIGESAFYGCKGLAAVVLPSSLTNISHHSFYGCSKLGAVSIPGGVQDVQREVFSSCTGLATVEIKSGIKSVGYGAFQSCSGLQSVTIPEGVELIDESAFQGCTRLRSITIPSTVDTVEAFAFADCSAMISVRIGNGVRFLGSYAFRDCKSLGGVDIPDSVIEIGSGLFNGCSTLKTVRLSQNIVELPWGCFYGNAMLTDITLPRSLKKISWDVFHDCSSLENLELNEGIESIGRDAFDGCKSLRAITIPSTVRDIEGSVLQGCDSLESINVASGNADYKSVNNCLVDMTGSRLVDIPYGCTTVVIPDGITEIPANAFCYDINVENIQIPDSVNQMGYNAISSCAKLKTITIPGSLYEIGENCISGCGSLESVVLCDGVCSIADGAFYYCPMLTSIEIPPTLSYVGAAFTSCNNLKTIYVHENDRARVEQLLANTYLKNLNVTYQEVSAGNQITIILNAMGGMMDESCVVRAVGMRIGDLPVPRRAGYEFLGWFSDATGGTMVTETTVASDDMTLYAHWLQNIVHYVVSFNANGGSCGTASKSYESGAVLGMLPTATRNGYTFDGWYTAASGGTQVTAETVVTGDMTLYAHWMVESVAMSLAIDNTDLSFVFGGSADWFGQVSVSHDGMNAAQSGRIGDGQQSSFQTTVSGAGTISFWWKVSSESNYDKLHFYVDGVDATAAISGETSWTQVSLALGSGSHTLRWEYAKDGSQANGNDCGWVDQVAWTQIKTYTVVFNADGGNGMMIQQTYEAEKVYKLPKCTFTRSAGNGFVGWAGSNGKRYDDEMLVFNLAPIGGSVTLKAIWDPAGEKEELGGVQLWENGPYWAECNVGATKPEECGYYFWWGDTVGYKRNPADNGWVSVKDGSSFSFSEGNCPTYGKNNSQLQSDGYIDSSGNLVAAHDAATAHLGAPWRMPTDAEFSALINNCDTEWTSRKGVSGRLVKGRGAYASKSIFLPAAGLGCDSDLYYLGSVGNYWSSTPYSGSFQCARYRIFDSGGFGWGNSSRYCGQSVRPLRGFAK